MSYAAAGDGSASLGSYVAPDGVRRSHRFNKNLRSMLEADFAGKPVSPDLAAILSISPSGGRRRGKMRGGAGELAAVGAFAARATATLRAAANSAIAATAASGAAGFAVNAALSAATKVARVSPKVAAAAGESAAAVGTTFDTAVSVIILGIGLFRALLGVGARIVGNVGAAADAAERSITSGENQQAVADAISSDAPAAITVAILALTQAGIVSLSTVIAIVLRVFGATLTGGGRALATLGFYAWYVTQEKGTQDAIKAKATATASGVAGAGKELAGLIAGGVVAAAKASKEAADRVVKGAEMAEAEATGAAERAAAELAEESKENVAAEIAAAAVVLAAVAESVPEAPAAARETRGKKRGADAVVEEAESAAGPAASRGKRGRGAPAGGGRKTKKVKKSKRRMTRRARPATLKFAY